MLAGAGEGPDEGAGEGAGEGPVEGAGEGVGEGVGEGTTSTGEGEGDEPPHPCSTWEDRTVVFVFVLNTCSIYMYYSLFGFIILCLEDWTGLCSTTPHFRETSWILVFRATPPTQQDLSLSRDARTTNGNRR